MKLSRFLLLAQTPPPYHGQAVMQQHLVTCRWNWCTMEHVRLQYSATIPDVGVFSFRKIGRLASVVAHVWMARSRGPIDVLYYPPGPPRRVPFYRDVVTLLLVRWAARRLVLHLHAGGFDRLQAMLTPPERVLASWAYGRADLAIVPATPMELEVAWTNARSVAVIGNGIPDLPAAVRATVPLGTGRILFVGNLSEEKGVLDLLESVRHLVCSGTSLTLVLVGAFRARRFGEEVLGFLHSAGLQSVVQLSGVLEGEELWAQYARADIFCFPTRETEAMPLVLLEAMRAGIPIVTTQWRTIPGIVGDAALLVPPRDPGALAAALGRLLNSADDRRRLGAAGRRRYEQAYTLERHLGEMERELRKVVRQ